jgi:AcrR family transcriptional regulator
MSSGDPETRKRILDETWRLMEESGGAEVRIADIARAAGVSRQAVYLHFASRTDLLVATVRHTDQVLELDRRLERLRAADSGPESLDEMVLFWADYLPHIYRLLKSLLAARDTDEAARAAWDDRMATLRDGCRGVIRCLEFDDSLAPQWTPEEAADLLYAMMGIGLWENLTADRDWTPDQYVARLQLALRRALVTTP